MQQYKNLSQFHGILSKKLDKILYIISRQSCQSYLTSLWTKKKCDGRREGYPAFLNLFFIFLNNKISNKHFGRKKIAKNVLKRNIGQFCQENESVK